MSRIGKKAVPVPAGVTVSVNGQTVAVKGPKGELKEVLNEQVLVKMQEDGVKVDPINQTKVGPLVLGHVAHTGCEHDEGCDGWLFEVAGNQRRGLSRCAGWQGFEVEPWL